jgi:hypothetical protein
MCGPPPLALLDASIRVNGSQDAVASQFKFLPVIRESRLNDVPAPIAETIEKPSDGNERRSKVGTKPRRHLRRSARELKRVRPSEREADVSALAYISSRNRLRCANDSANCGPS